MWSGEGYNIFERWMFLLPDWLNLIGSSMFLLSACLYPYQFSPEGEKTEWFDCVQRIEFIAINIEFLAAILWLWQWFEDYRRDLRKDAMSCFGRGFTFDDPDLWANITLVIAAFYYLQYSTTVYFDRSKYDTCLIYEQADTFYFINSVFYIICSARDCGVFWFLPKVNIRLYSTSYLYMYAAYVNL
jgi:hypothetical protein